MAQRPPSDFILLYCRSARGYWGITYLTELEASEDLKHEWIGLHEAIKKREDSNPASDLGKNIKERDLFFLTEYKRDHAGD